MEELTKHEEERKTSLRNKWWLMFDNDPLEDCFDHPVQTEIRHALESCDRSLILKWLFEFATDLKNPSFAISMVRCIGRQEQIGDADWRASIVKTALSSDILEMRDEAIRAAEFWAEPRLRELLAEHQEPVDWLRSYLVDVVHDMAT